MESIRVFIRRHAERPIDLQKGVLTKRGRISAEALGKKLKKSKRPKLYTSPAKRSVETAKLVRKSSRTSYHIRIRQELFRFIKPSAPIENLEKLLAIPSPDLVQKWLRGKTDKRVFFTPEEVTQEIIYRLRHVARVKERSLEENIRIEAISHDISIMALLKVLTGKTPSSSYYPKPLGTLQLIFGKRIILRYKGIRKDITQRFYTLLNEAKKEKNNVRKRNEIKKP